MQMETCIRTIIWTAQIQPRIDRAIIVNEQIFGASIAVEI
jgi:hypothetical protein